MEGILFKLPVKGLGVEKIILLMTIMICINKYMYVKKKKRRALRF